MDRRKALAVQGWESLFRSQVTLIRRFKQNFRDAEITLGEYDVLYTLTLAEGRRLRLHTLNQSILLTQPSLSRLIERMERSGLVRREPDPEDGRGTVVVMTEHGAAVQHRVGREHAASIGRYVGGALTQRELATLRRLCDKLRHAQADIPE